MFHFYEMAGGGYDRRMPQAYERIDARIRLARKKLERVLEAAYYSSIAQNYIGPAD